MRTSYDPFNRDEERELEQLAAAREEHELWSLEQAQRGNSAAQRESAGVWVKRAPAIPEEMPDGLR
jgi:hypothetical protein